MTTIPSFFFFNDTATTEIYTLSLHDALPIYCSGVLQLDSRQTESGNARRNRGIGAICHRSEEHTSELQSRLHVVCRLLLEKKNELGINLALHLAHSDTFQFSVELLLMSHLQR